MQENQEKRMIRVSQLNLPVEHSEEQFYQKIEKSLKIKRDQIKKLQIVKKSIDARKKPEVSIDLVQQRLNPNLLIEGVVFTMYDVRTNLSNQVVENVRNNLDAKIYDTLIPRNIRLAEAPSYGLPINLYDSKSAGAESYRLLAKEVIDRKDI